ncbi:MAG: hypothetical protein V2A76_12465 [Planctomycetota bacterium]
MLRIRGDACLWIFGLCFRPKGIIQVEEEEESRSTRGYRMSEIRFLGIALSLTLAATPLAYSSSVSTSVSEGGTPSDPTTTVTITVTAGSGETIKDFHIFPTPDGSKLDGGSTFDQPDGWGAPTGSGSKKKGKHWKVNGGGSGFSNPGTGEFTITVPGNAASQTWGMFAWVTSDNGSSTTPGEGGDGWVDGGTSGPTELVPIAMLQIIGPETVAVGETARFRVEAGVAESEILSYTVSAALTLDATSLDRVSSDYPLPQSWGIEISTNSRLGTIAIGEGASQATYFGNRRNHILVDIPDDLSLVGRTIYLQVDFGNGDCTPPKAIRIVSE